MSAQVCPVCGGKGLVPNGFYISVGASDYYTTNSTAPETCRSCGGKGYIIEYSDSCQYPVYNSCRSCSNCDNNDRMCYTSNPPKYKCIVDNTFHFAYDSCDKYKEQEPVYLYNASLLNNQDK